MIHFLKQPYPIPETDWKSIFREAAITGTPVALFLIIFQPFGLAFPLFSKTTLLVIPFGLITAFAVICSKLIFRQIFKKYDETKWTVGKEIWAQIVIVIAISIFNYIYAVLLIGVLDFTWIGLFTMIKYTILVAFLPILGLVLLQYHKLLTEYSTAAKLIKIEQKENIKTQVIDNKDFINEKILLIAENEKDTFEIDIKKLLFIESTDNYVTIHQIEGQRVQKTILRSTLTRVSSQINAPNIRKIHRSYIANFDKVISISGNAQGYKLHFAELDFQIPVARQSSKTVLDFFR